MSAACGLIHQPTAILHHILSFLVYTQDCARFNRLCRPLHAVPQDYARTPPEDPHDLDVITKDSEGAYVHQYMLNGTRALGGCAVYTPELEQYGSIRFANIAFFRMGEHHSISTTRYLERASVSTTVICKRTKTQIYHWSLSGRTEMVNLGLWPNTVGESVARNTIVSRRYDTDIEVDAGRGFNQAWRFDLRTLNLIEFEGNEPWSPRRYYHCRLTWNSDQATIHAVHDPEQPTWDLTVDEVEALIPEDVLFVLSMYEPIA